MTIIRSCFLFRLDNVACKVVLPFEKSTENCHQFNDWLVAVLHQFLICAQLFTSLWLLYIRLASLVSYTLNVVYFLNFVEHPLSTSSMIVSLSCLNISPTSFPLPGRISLRRFLFVMAPGRFI